MSNNIQVAIKIRPLIAREFRDNLQNQWRVDENKLTPISGSNDQYTFDHVLTPETTNDYAYNILVKPIVDAALSGMNATVFAYGQTSSGKTYTMMGSGQEPGLITLAVQDIFSAIQHSTHRDYLIRVSYIEIYNEKVVDLLDKNSDEIKIHEDYNGDVYVRTTEEVVTSAELLFALKKRGDKNRSVGVTNMNDRSSRSHTIFKIIIESRESTDFEIIEGAVQVAHLNLVDLAGSERASQTGATGARLKEGQYINKSLSTLGLVIRQLSEAGDSSQRFISFRDSKLTRILQSSLGGNAKTVIICNITPVSYEESVSTLLFASSAKNIKNKPKVNEIVSDEAMLKRLGREVQELKKISDQDKKNLAQAKEKNENLEKRIEELQQKILRPMVLQKHRRRTWCAQTSTSLSPSAVEVFELPLPVVQTPLNTKPKTINEDDIQDTDSGWNSGDFHSNLTRKESKLSIATNTSMSSSNIDIDFDKEIKDLKEYHESERKSIMEEYDNLKEQYERVSKQLNEIQKNNQCENEKLCNKIKKMEKEMEILNDSEYMLQTSVKKYSSRIKDLESLLNNANNEKGIINDSFQSFDDTEKLNKRILALEKENAVLRKDNEAFKINKEKIILENKIQEISIENDKIKVENVELKEICKKFEESEKLINSKFKILESNHKNILIEKNKLLDDLKITKDENTVLRTKVSDTDESKIKLTDLETKYQSLNDELKNIKNENSTLNRQNEIINTEKIKLQDGIEKTQEEIEVLKNKIITLTEEKQQLYNEVSKLTNQIENCQKINKEEKNSLNQEIQNLSEERSNLKIEFENVQKLYNVLETNLEMKNKDNENLRQELVGLKIECEKLNGEKISIDEEKTILVKKVNELKEKIDSQELNDKINLEQIANLKINNQDLHQKLKNVLTEKDILNDKLQENMLEKSKVDSELLNLEKQNSELLEKFNRISGEQIQQYIEEKQSLDNKIKQLYEENAQLSEELDKIKTQINDHNKNMKNNIEQLNFMKKQLDEKMIENSELSKKMNTLKMQSNDLQQKNLQLKEDYKNLQSELNDVTEEMMEHITSDSTDDLKKEIQSLKNDKEAVENELKQCQINYEKLQEEKELLEFEIMNISTHHCKKEIQYLDEIENLNKSQTERDMLFENFTDIIRTQESQIDVLERRNSNKLCPILEMDDDIGKNFSDLKETVLNLNDMIVSAYEENDMFKHKNRTLANLLDDYSDLIKTLKKKNDDLEQQLKLLLGQESFVDSTMNDMSNVLELSLIESNKQPNKNITHNVIKPILDQFNCKQTEVFNLIEKKLLISEEKFLKISKMCLELIKNIEVVKGVNVTLKSENLDMQKKLISLEGVISADKGTIESFNMENRELKDLLLHRNSEYELCENGRKKILNDMNALQQNFNDLQNLRNTLISENDRLKQDSFEKNKLIDILQLEKQDLIQKEQYVNELKTSLVHEKTEKENLLKCNETLKEKLDHISNDYDEIKFEISSLNTSISNLKTENTNLQEECTKLNNLNENLKLEIISLKTENDKQKSEYDSLKIDNDKQIKDFTERILVLENEKFNNCEKLQIKLKDLNNLNENLKLEIISLKTENDKQKSEYDSLKIDKDKQIKDFTERILVLENEKCNNCEKLQIKLKDLNNLNENLKLEIISLKTENDKQKSEYDSLKIDNDKQIKDFTERILVLENEKCNNCEKLQNILKDLKILNENLKLEIISLKTENDKQKNEYNSLKIDNDKQIKDFTERILVLENEKCNNCEKLQNILKDLKILNKNLESEIITLHAEYENVTKENDTKEKMIGELNSRLLFVENEKINMLPIDDDQNKKLQDKYDNLKKILKEYRIEKAVLKEQKKYLEKRLIYANVTYKLPRVNPTEYDLEKDDEDMLQDNKNTETKKTNHQQTQHEHTKSRRQSYVDTLRGLPLSTKTVQKYISVGVNTDAETKDSQVENKKYIDIAVNTDPGIIEHLNRQIGLRKLHNEKLKSDYKKEYDENLKLREANQIFQAKEMEYERKILKLTKSKIKSDASVNTDLLMTEISDQDYKTEIQELKEKVSRYRTLSVKRREEILTLETKLKSNIENNKC